MGRQSKGNWVTVRSERRRRVDIEVLLQWAFRDELPKRTMPAFGPSYISPLSRLVSLGVSVDTSDEPGFPAALGEPHPDSLVIEHAVLSLEDARIDWPATRRSMIGPLGGLLSDNEPTLKHLTIGLPGLVAVHAKLKSRPRWDQWPAPEPVIGPNGKPKVQFENEHGRLVEGRKGRHYGPNARSPLLWFPAPREAAFVRIEYSIWWQAVDTLADHLRDALCEHEPLPPAAHPSPWMAKN
jgi:hypothetical protein